MEMPAIKVQVVPVWEADNGHVYGVLERINEIEERIDALEQRI